MSIVWFALGGCRLLVYLNPPFPSRPLPCRIFSLGSNSSLTGLAANFLFAFALDYSDFGGYRRTYLPVSNELVPKYLSFFNPSAEMGYHSLSFFMFFAIKIKVPAFMVRHFPGRTNLLFSGRGCVDETGFDRLQRSLDPVIHLQFGIERAYIIFHSLFSQVEPFGNFTVVIALGNKG